MLWHLTLRITHSVEAEAQRGDLNPGKAQVLPSLCRLPSVIPSAPLVGDAGREAAGTADSHGREGCLDGIRPPATKALPPPHLGLCSSRWPGFPVHSPPAQNQLVSSWGTQPGLGPAHLLDLPFPRMFPSSQSTQDQAWTSLQLIQTPGSSTQPAITVALHRSSQTLKQEIQ